MRLNKLFKLLIDAAFFLMIPIVVFFPGMILYILIFPEQSVIQVNIPFTSNGFGAKALLFSLLFFSLFLLFFLGFYQLRKFAGLLLKGKLFSKAVVICTHKGRPVIYRMWVGFADLYRYTFSSKKRRKLQRNLWYFQLQFTALLTHCGCTFSPAQ